MMVDNLSIYLHRPPNNVIHLTPLSSLPIMPPSFLAGKVVSADAGWAGDSQ